MWFLESLARSLNVTFTLISVLRTGNSDVDCPHPEPGQLSFKGFQFAKEIKGRLGAVHNLHCCTNGYDTLYWYKHDEKTGNWDIFPWYKGNSLVRMGKSDKNQTLVLEDPLLGSDDGTYKCVATNSTTGEVKEQETRLTLIDCVTLSKGPIPLDQPGHIYGRIGQTITLTCKGYFGCGNSFTRSVDWRRDSLGTKISNPRYTITKFISSDETTLGANLTIRHLIWSDFNKPFHCFLKSSEFVGPSTHISMKISPIP